MLDNYWLLLPVLPDQICRGMWLIKLHRRAEECCGSFRIVCLGNYGAFLFFKGDECDVRGRELVIVVSDFFVYLLFNFSDFLEILLGNRCAAHLE